MKNGVTVMMVGVSRNEECGSIDFSTKAPPQIRGCVLWGARRIRVEIANGTGGERPHHVKGFKGMKKGNN